MNQPEHISSANKAMAKKSQTNSRRKSTQTGKMVVNIYNHGTINFDGRQNKSVNNKQDYRGSTLTYHNVPNSNRVGDYIEPAQPKESNADIIEIQAQETNCSQPVKSNRISNIGKILIGTAITAIATGAVILVIQSN